MFFNRANFAFIASRLLLESDLPPLKEVEDFGLGGDGFRSVPDDEDFMLRSRSLSEARERPLLDDSKSLPLRSGE
mgnify:CR=1 FL=1